MASEEPEALVLGADGETIKRRAMKDNGHYAYWDWDALKLDWDPLMLTDCGIQIDCGEDVDDLIPKMTLLM